MKRFAQILICTLLVMASGPASLIADEKLPLDQVNFFESKIRPVLVRECYGCHSTQVGQIKGGLWLDSADGARTGGDSGPAVVAGNLEESLLWNAINHEDFSMPPKKKLSADIIGDFRKWIEMGAPDPRNQPVGNVSSSITPADIENGKKFWSFQPAVAPKVPETNSDWPRTDIDRFVLEKLSANELRPSDDADPSTVLRRLTFDLIGLPPTPGQMADFQSDWNRDPAAAVEQMADSLLSQTQFGERWGRHWLDVARYAESTGKELNLTFPHAWRYRDYVIESFNNDKPYNRFVQEQIAGDLLPVKTDEQWSENLVATGFLTFGPKTLTEQNARQFELDLIDEQIDVTTRVMLGVSVACARCHDHKFDPIPQTDYYALAGIFRNMTTHYGTFDNQQNRRPSNLVMLPVDDLSPFDKPISTKQLAELKSQLEEKRVELREAQRQRRMARMNSSAGNQNPQLSIANYARLTTQVGMLESKISSYDDTGKPLTYCMAVQETERPINARLLERGEFNQPAQEVPRGFPQVLCDQTIEIKSSSSGRLELARWIGSEENSLAARVMVNRVWLHLFGNGIVRTPEDFGTTGQSPTHPQLLDHLAVEFMKNDWSVKQLVRSIVVSHIYRTSSQFNQTSFENDPENNYLWRREPRRLDAEVIRDSMLSISGRLDQSPPRASIVASAGHALVRDGMLISTVGTGEMGMAENNRAGRFMDTMRRNRNGMDGNTLRPTITTLDQTVNYRSVYLPIVRDNVPRSLEVFDFAESTMVIGQRETSNTPDQGLYFLNNAFVMEQADAMARRLMDEADRLKDQLKQAFLLAYGRPATSSEMRSAEGFYRSFKPSGSRYRANEQEFQKLSAICQAIMASAEFRIVN